ncbi:hypothetical protein N7466_006974, partial [Penicillium verhagenii]|uniref:uncharacterized protein n=1 Tax=Penicillium verhagenii TaxID=1562060 RepID=UPI002544FFBC
SSQESGPRAYGWSLEEEQDTLEQFPTKYPRCAGHEIVGTVVRIGSEVKDYRQIGDRVVWVTLLIVLVATSNTVRGLAPPPVLVPDGLASHLAAPMLCGGTTIYSPLKHHGCGPEKRVGIIDIGGIGHFGIIFAKALGAQEVVAISRRANKRRRNFAVRGRPIREMLNLAEAKCVHPWVQVAPMKDANQALLDTAAGKARFRVLEN